MLRYLESVLRQSPSACPNSFGDNALEWKRERSLRISNGERWRLAWDELGMAGEIAPRSHSPVDAVRWAHTVILKEDNSIGPGLCGRGGHRE